MISELPIPSEEARDVYWREFQTNPDIMRMYIDTIACKLDDLQYKNGNFKMSERVGRNNIAKEILILLFKPTGIGASQRPQAKAMGLASGD